MFGLPGTWNAVDPAGIDIYADTGELTLPVNAVGLGYSEIDLVYTAGLATIPDAVKVACAQIVRNAQATPALNVRIGKTGPHATGLLLRQPGGSDCPDPAGAVRGAESGLSMSETGMNLAAVVRAAEAMLRSLGGAEVRLLFPLVTMANDPSANWVWRIPESRK